jgi:periplasmic divalent cation tolerance protein
MNSTYNVIICTVPNEETAAKISRTLVTEKLAACCNIIPGLRSIYRWKSEICDDAEYLLVIKTRAEVYERLEKRIQELHPYEVPEILALTVNQGLSNYLKWVDENVE